MGWDAFATKDGKMLKCDYSKEAEWAGMIVNPILRDAFGKANDKGMKIAGSVDGLLRDGGLDCSDCAYALRDATGMDCWSEDNLTPEVVKYYWEEAGWPPRDEWNWAVASAYYFLKTCAKNGLGIYFSW